MFNFAVYVTCHWYNLQWFNPLHNNDGNMNTLKFKFQVNQFEIENTRCLQKFGFCQGWLINCEPDPLRKWEGLWYLLWKSNLVSCSTCSICNSLKMIICSYVLIQEYPNMTKWISNILCKIIQSSLPHFLQIPIGPSRPITELVLLTPWPSPSSRASVTSERTGRPCYSSCCWLISLSREETAGSSLWDKTNCPSPKCLPTTQNSLNLSFYRTGLWTCMILKGFGDFSETLHEHF